MLCLRKLYFRAFTWLFSGNDTDYKLQRGIFRPPLQHPLTKDKSPQPNDRPPVKEIHRSPIMKWAALTRPRQQDTRIAIPTTAEKGHAPLHTHVEYRMVARQSYIILLDIDLLDIDRDLTSHHWCWHFTSACFICSLDLYERQINHTNAVDRYPISLYCVFGTEVYIIFTIKRRHLLCGLINNKFIHSHDYAMQYSHGICRILTHY